VEEHHSANTTTTIRLQQVAIEAFEPTVVDHRSAFEVRESIEFVSLVLPVRTGTTIREVLKPPTDRIDMQQQQPTQWKYPLNRGKTDRDTGSQ
jgi:hypothetical protein